MKKQSGITIVETVIVAVIVAFVAVVVFPSLFRSVASKDQFQLAQIDLLTGLDSLAQHVLRVGRLAGGVPTAGPTYHTCTVTSAPSTLNCRIDLAVPPAGVLSLVRFIHDSTKQEVHYETRQAGTWTSIAIYKGIESFALCADAAGCTLVPDKINTDYQALLASGIPAEARNRFIRFRITALAKSNLNAAQNRRIFYQSAFYVRNPPRFDAGAAFTLGPR